MRRKFWLVATTSALAIGVVISAQAAPTIYNTPGPHSLDFVAGTYEIIVSGAQGGSFGGGYGPFGGAGATVLGQFQFAAPGTFTVLVGGEGNAIGAADGSFGGAGGGGGSFVFVSGGNTAVAVAGGGGGSGRTGGGGAASGANGTDSGGAAGASTVPGGGGGGGGGFSAVGTNAAGFHAFSGAGGGAAATGTAVGGPGGDGTAIGSAGGFGGGGGGGGGGFYNYIYGRDGYRTYGQGGGGGGGGFGGGAGGGGNGSGGGGGSSYLNAGLLLGGTGYRYNGGNYVDRLGRQSGFGNGYVFINLISAAETVPEPGSMGLFGLSLAGLALARRRFARG